MNKTLKICAVLLFSLFVLSSLALAANEEQIMITTYYPSPYGSYQELDVEKLYFRENVDGLIAFKYPDTTYDRRLRITAGLADGTTNTQGASIDLHGNNYTGQAGDLDLVAGAGGNVNFFSSPAGSAVAQRMIVTNAGNVGIGTSAPASRFHVHNTAASALSNAQFTNGTTGSASTDGLHVGIDTDNNDMIWSRDNNAIKFATNNTERVRVDNAGNVGIGITAPLSRLHVQGAGATSATSALQVINSSSSLGLIVDNAGNVGIGEASAGARLHIRGSTGQILNILDSGSNLVMRIRADGHIGIGTGGAVDTHTLNVTGGLRVASAGLQIVGGGLTVSNGGVNIGVGTRYAVGGVNGLLSQTLTVAKSGGGSCTITVKGGIITSTSCP